MTQQASPQPLPPPPDPFQLATSLIRHAREALDEIKNAPKEDTKGIEELQAEVAQLKQRLDQLESKVG